MPSKPRKRKVVRKRSTNVYSSSCKKSGSVRFTANGNSLTCTGLQYQSKRTGQPAVRKNSLKWRNSLFAPVGVARLYKTNPIAARAARAIPRTTQLPQGLPVEAVIPKKPFRRPGARSMAGMIAQPGGVLQAPMVTGGVM